MAPTTLLSHQLFATYNPLSFHHLCINIKHSLLYLPLIIFQIPLWFTFPVNSMATAEVVSVQTALHEEKAEEPIKVEETTTAEAVDVAPTAKLVVAEEEPKEEESKERQVQELEAPIEEGETKAVTREPEVEKKEVESPKETVAEPVAEETTEPTVEEIKESTDSSEAAAEVEEPKEEVAKEEEKAAEAQVEKTE